VSENFARYLKIRDQSLKEICIILAIFQGDLSGMKLNAVGSVKVVFANSFKMCWIAECEIKQGPVSCEYKIDVTRRQ
jgi:hypothetical protein